MSMNPPIARLFRAGQAREVQPACGALRRTLRTIAHVAAPLDDQSLKVCAVPIPLYDDIEVIGEPGLACWAGWEPVVRRLLVADGYQIDTIGSPRRPLPRPDFGRFQRLGLVDHALLDCMCQQERALIRYAGEYADPV